MPCLHNRLDDHDVSMTSTAGGHTGSKQVSIYVNTFVPILYQPSTQNYCHHSLYSVQAVVKANSQSNGKCKFRLQRNSKTPERILMKPRIYNYIVGMTTATTWVVTEYT